MKPATMKTVEAVHCMIAERIPLGCTVRFAMEECRRVARRYVEERGLPESVALAEIDEADIVAWLRAQGYEMLDEPFSPYADHCKRVVPREWGPRK